MSEPDWEREVRERAKVAGVTFDEPQIGAVAKELGRSLEALDTYRSMLRGWDEPSTKFEPRNGRQP